MEITRRSIRPHWRLDPEAAGVRGDLWRWISREQGEQPAPQAADAVVAPRIEPGSMLDTMTQHNPGIAEEFGGVVLGDIRRCIERCTLAKGSLDQILEQIHALKSVLVWTGSGPLLESCEKLRRDACMGVDPGVLHERYIAVGNAAAEVVRSFIRYRIEGFDRAQGTAESNV